jgi:hypothetical protein
MLLLLLVAKPKGYMVYILLVYGLPGMALGYSQGLDNLVARGKKVDWGWRIIAFIYAPLVFVGMQVVCVVVFGLLAVML